MYYKAVLEKKSVVLVEPSWKALFSLLWLSEDHVMGREALTTDATKMTGETCPGS